MRLWVKAYSWLFFDYNCKDKHLIHGPRGLDKSPNEPKTMNMLESGLDTERSMS